MDQGQEEGGWNGDDLQRQTAISMALAASLICGEGAMKSAQLSGWGRGREKG